ncbi:unnamed protein product [Effrenium voratum]|uniref:Fibronectin type-III domain-containing protein n=1 Tax=Effrenium voratum TaxID=2562239 RepID=A0AA36ITJ9_9DINO|nr:unnamed protein product [Effrenium voratum]CAJ1393723.1 unnamed protein product [Effrenium voratum]
MLASKPKPHPLVQVSINWCFGWQRPGLGGREDVAIGDDALGDIYGEECMYMPVAAPKQKCSLSRLLPGQDYYFIVRAVASSGKGEFSKVLGPCTTEKESPQKAQALELHDIELYTCSTRLRLPFNYGSPITEVHTVLRRLDGPLALEEMDEEGQVHAHVAGQEHTVAPSSLVAVDDASEASRRPQTGVTGALLRTFATEGFDKASCRFTSRKSSLECCTGRSYVVNFSNLRPGTEYEITWRCRNAMGQSPFSGALLVKTDPAAPDQPPPIAVESL